jgi:hypothetical protein
MNSYLNRFLIVCLAVLGLGSCGGGGDVSAERADPSARPISKPSLSKPPLYWSVYGYHIVRQQQESSTPDAISGTDDFSTTANNYIPEAEFQANIDWVEAKLKPFGYDMVAMDGWGDTLTLNEHGYRASHSQNWVHDYAWWSQHLRSRGMRLGMYANPLTVLTPSTDMETKIVGTDILVSSLIDTSESTLFRWVQVDRPGAEQYVKGYIAYYANMGIDHLRIDFLSWYENGFDRYLGRVGPDRPRQDYATALRWMREAADQHGMYLSVAMAHLYNEAELERQYASSIRINEDVDYGEWWKFSGKDRGQRFENWSQWANAADGFTYWSYLSGRGKVRLDGDFLRMTTFSTDSERRTAMSMGLIAGGPIAVADRYNTIGKELQVYQNEEMLALNLDGFVGKPRVNDPTNEASQIWTGQMSNGDVIVGLFNRESTTRSRSISLAEVGIKGEFAVRDLWQRAPLPATSAISVQLAPHASMILRLTPGASTSCNAQSIEVDAIGDVDYGNPGPKLSATASSGLPVQFEVALGAAEISANQAQPTGKSGIVYVVATQPGDGTWCAAIPVTKSFAVIGGHQPAMYIGASFTNFATSIEMQLKDEIWIAQAVQIPAGNHEFKFTNSDSFSKKDWGNAQGLSGVAVPTTGGGSNIKFSVPEDGFYRVKFNDLTLEYSLQRVNLGIY